MVEPLNFQRLLDSLMTAVIVLDSDFNLFHINNAGEVLLSVSNDQVKGRHYSEYFEEVDGTSNSFFEALNDNKSFTKRRAQWRLHNLNSIAVDYSVSPNNDNASIIIEVQPLDRLLRINREEALISTQETSRNLIKSLAHEIKNPLGGIRGAAQLLARELNENELIEYTRIVIDETDRLRDLVDRMLGPNRQTRHSSLNIHEVLEYVSSVVSAEAAKEIVVERDYDPSIPNIHGDKDQLIQAVLNIARNAMQALLEQEKTNETYQARMTLCTRIHRRYTIGARHYPLVARVDVSDNGPGIPEHLVNTIFFPMITGRAEGTGLGLAIAQNLINLHGGLIECDSEPGNTLFSIYLPLEDTYA